MRRRVQHEGLTVNVVAGTHVVFFGMDLDLQQRSKFRGFAFRRTDHAENETVWLVALKTFEKTEPHPSPSERFSTRFHPIQSFQWADYSAKPGRSYTYDIVTRYGDPAALKSGSSVTVEVTTELETGPTHSAFFNRGSVATQEYARRFENRKPSEEGQAAYDWLSRGLLEALVAFIGRAGSGWKIHGAVYEFQWPAVLEALRKAKQRGAKVSILFDNRETRDKDGKATGPWERNREAIAKARIKSVCKGRVNGRLMHNKFFILTHGKKPAAVWTGSTNLTENGIFGHSNVGHIVEDETVAHSFLDYWERLRDDPEIDADYRSANVKATATPPVPWDSTTTTVFSPRNRDLDCLNWYAQIAGAADSALLMTFAFGMHPTFNAVYQQNSQVLKMALMEKEYRSHQTKDADTKELAKARRRPEVVVAVGNRIVTNSFDRWLAELSRIIDSVHVYWVHTKYMLVDPFGDQPVVVSGSANFSEASCHTNDENMLVIRGDKRIADIYFGEYMRLYTHYAFREAVKWAMQSKQVGKPEKWKPNFLVDDDSWMKQYFDPQDRSGRFARRAYFAGPLSL